ncbi:MAG: hypothetical protein IKQ95_01195 [Synergistaceae bacterium]|nr:hypothetical protein [Synergistaceae bacterium]
MYLYVSSNYDTIYFGYPIWWGDIPMPLYTFVEAHDWSGNAVAVKAVTDMLK